MSHLPRPNSFLSLRFLIVVAAAHCLLPAALLAQAGDAKDKPGAVQREIWREIDTPPAPVLSPEEALQTFEVAPGFRLELVASEPLINDPVAIAWDEDGRLWATEFWSYMPDVDGHGESERRGRVVVLEDHDEDGRMDTSTVFLDNLILPRAIAIVEGGALIADPPYLYYCEDTDGDLVCDRKSLVAEYASTGNPEHAENGLLRGLDNWLYNAKSDRRFQFADGELLEDKTLFRGQWGIAQDDYGRLYYNHNSFPLYVDAVPYDRVNRHPGWSPEAGFSLAVPPDPSLHPARVTPGINRAYRPNHLAPDYRLMRADAASAPTIYRGHRYPEPYRGDAFVPDPAGNLVAAYQLHDDELDVYGAQRLQPSHEWGAVSFIASTDERFRPVAVATGPDGYLYIVDMYRGIIQHKTYLTSFLRKQIIERDLDDPVGLGRIYRLVHEDDPAERSVPALSRASDQKLVTLLQSENGWQRDTAQRLLIERAPLSEQVIQDLKKTVADGEELARIHALWTLKALGRLDVPTVQSALRDASAWVETHAWRTGGELLAELSPEHPLWQRYRDALAAPEKRVQLEALYTLPLVASPEEVVDTVVSNAELGEDPFYLDAFVSALYGREQQFLAELREAQAKPTEAANALITALAEAAYEAKVTPQPQQLAALSENLPWPQQLYRRRQAELQAEETAASLDRYSQGQVELIENGRPLYQNLCAVCHKDDGQGQASLAPPLAGSEWVTGSKQRLVRVVAQGLEGPIQVKGEEWDMVMPAHGHHPLLQGDNMAAVLSYIRAAWGNQSSTISPHEVESALAPVSDRDTPWTAQELTQ